MPPLHTEVERAVRVALETYSNVHRGSGHHSLVSTRLYEHARDIVLDDSGFVRKTHEVIFCSPRRATALMARLSPGSHRCISSQEVGLPLGLRALVVERQALPKGVPFETGGGTARLVAPRYVIWANGPERFEAGTPAIINVIAFARALQWKRQVRSCVDVVSSCDNPEGMNEPLETRGRPLLNALRQTLIGRGARVPTVDGERVYVNLDNAASTPTFESIWAAVRRAWRKPPTEHAQIVQRGKVVCADVLGAPLAAYDVIFTSNTTEAINVVAESLGKEQGVEEETVVLNTYLEHNSNELPWRATSGLSLVRLPVDSEGFVDLTQLNAILCEYNDKKIHGRKRIKLVAVCGASNVLGVYSDIAAISRIAHAHGARLLVDGAQWIAHRKIEVANWGIDFLAFSGHKTYAPFGTGALIAKKGALAFDALTLETLQASGEENVGGIAGVTCALEMLERIGFDVIEEDERALTRRTLEGLAKLPPIKTYGVKAPNAPKILRKGGVIAFEVKGKLPGRVAKSLAEQGGIGVRFGCHCAHLIIKKLLGVPRWAERLQYFILTFFRRMSLPGVLRISFGIQNTEADVDAVLACLGQIVHRPSGATLGRRREAFVEAAVHRVYAPFPELP